MNAALDLAAIAAAVDACPGVSALSPHPWSAADDHEGGRRGIAADEHTVEIAVIAFYGERLAVVVGQIETAVRPLVADRRLVVTIDDLDTRPRPT